MTVALLEEVRSAIELEGVWQDEEEWRISTYMNRSVRPVETHGSRWFEVTVESGTELSCHAPTLERALEFMFVFERLVMDLFWTLGWSSWAAPRRLAPEDGETLP